MPDAFLDSSVAIGLIFRNAGERWSCAQAIPAGAARSCSRYVIFEIGRGFLLNLIVLHNTSFGHRSVADLLLATRSGQLRYRHHRSDTWFGAFVDYLTTLDEKDGKLGESLQLEEFRAKLAACIRRGWKKLHTDFKPLTNDVGCREDLPSPVRGHDGLLEHLLPTDECGNPSACRLQDFFAVHRHAASDLADRLDSLPQSSKDTETTRRIAALRHLLEVPHGKRFLGKQCHHCGDALICLEAPPSHMIVTKNRKHFEPIAAILGKTVAIALTARTTKPSES